MSKKLLLPLLAVAALSLPAAAIAGKPHNKPSHGKGQPTVSYVLKGTLSAYSAASTSGNGTITIDVTHSNHHGRALVGQSLTLGVTSQTKIVLNDGATTITDGDQGVVTVRAAKNVAAADLVTTLQAANARQVVDQGVHS